MCGIAGILNFKNNKNDRLDAIRNMVDIQYHRGPDESGIYIDHKIALGHARLSIIDIACGTQPIHNEDKSLWIIYNGEVYNYPELRKELINKGHEFYTSTDTEVILHLYEEKGIDFLNYLNGQFAIAIWDTNKQELLLARDRVGIRPLYYTKQKDRFIFASEIKAIFTNKNISREIAPEIINQIFTFWTPLPGRTVFKGIMELPPGHFAKISEKGIESRQYWHLPLYQSENHLDWPKEQIMDEINDLLLDAVKIRLRADVPVGCYLSGGLDSSIIATLVSQNFNNDVSTFGIRFEEDDFDEGRYQELMASYLETAHTELKATNDLIGKSLPDVLWHCEQPLLRTGPIPLYLLSKLVAENNYKVVLTGEGADEIFGGYNIFREAKVRKFWAKQPDSKFRGLLVKRLYPYIFENKRLGKMLQAFFAKSLDQAEDPLFSHLIRWNNTSKIKYYLSHTIREKSDGDDIFKELKEELPDSFDSLDYLNKAQFLEISLFLSKYLLSSQGDRVAMGNSLEIRLPYLDYRIIEFMAKVPSKWKIRGLNEKYILKKSFNNIIPDEIIRRHKKPYRAPIAQSLLKSDNNYTNHILSKTMLKQAGFFDPLSVKKLLEKLQNAQHISERDNMALIGILSTQIIYEQFINNFSYKSQPIDPIIIDRR